MDALVGELQQRLGTPGEGLVDYFYVATETDETPLSDYCESGDSVGLLACTNENQEVFSRVIPQEHELVHAVHAETGFSHPFLEEGLAEFLGDDGHMMGRDEPTGTVSDAIASVRHERLPLGNYAIAGHFVSYLDATMGTGTIVDRIDDVAFDGSAADVKAALARGVAGGFAELEGQYEGAPKCAQAAYRDAEAMCNVAAPLLESCSPEEDTIVDVVVDCTGDDVLGPREDEIWTYRTLDIVNPGTYTFLARGGAEDLPEGLEIRPCGGGCESPPTAVLVYDEDEVFASRVDVELEAGRYLARITRPIDDPATVQIEFGGDGCE